MSDCAHGFSCRIARGYAVAASCSGGLPAASARAATPPPSVGSRAELEPARATTPAPRACTRRWPRRTAARNRMPSCCSPRVSSSCARACRRMPHRVLASIAPPLTPDQSFERQLLGVELAARAQPGARRPGSRLSAIPQPATAPAAARYLESKEQRRLRHGSTLPMRYAPKSLASAASRAAHERNTARARAAGRLREPSERGVKSIRAPPPTTWYGAGSSSPAWPRRLRATPARPRRTLKRGAPAIPVIPRTRSVRSELLGSCSRPPRERVSRTSRCCCRCPAARRARRSACAMGS